MSKIKNVLNKGVAKLNQVALNVMYGDSHFVAIVVAIIVCIALAGIFRSEISSFITTIIGNATSNANNLF